MYEWKVRASAAPADTLLEKELNGLEREGFEIFQIQWTHEADGAPPNVYVIARREVARRNTDIESLLADQAAGLRGRSDPDSP